MKALLFSVCLVVVGASTSPLEGQRETENMFPEISHSLQILTSELTTYKETIESKFERLKETCQQRATERSDIAISTDQEIFEKGMAQFEDKMLRFSNATTEKIRKEISEALEETLKKLDVKLQPLHSEIASLKGQLLDKVTKEDLRRLENALTVIALNVTERIRNDMAQLPTKEEMQEHYSELKAKLEETFSTYENQSRCDDTSKLEEILGKLTKSDLVLEEVYEYLRNDSRNSQCSSTMNDITELIRKLDDNMGDNSNLVTALDTLVHNMQKSFLDKLEEMENLAEEYQEKANPVEETQVQVHSTPGRSEPVDCIDSTFVGSGRSLNVCQAAVRFQKCHLEFVAFHCCHSCQEAGLLSSLPHYIGPRTVPVLQALRSLRPSA
ncbi:putative leucine-rich repeat-containing protein DDB_G0290503 [Macrobrachium rosenbergii]|uniref:putative leucine-rich repeat-containing protein DDB_G0290503 n=1 Tax=Macrobrachium rosenbergii TaxID=79674 RepID=UPI0034D50D1A